MPNFEFLARLAYERAEANYTAKGGRYDVIVECMTIGEIAKALEAAGVSDRDGAEAWCDREAGLAHEQELNMAWDGPESCIGSENYDPAHDPAGPRDVEPEEPSSERLHASEAGMSLEERFEHYAFEERNGMPYGSSF